jgi:hypothetical protein
MAAANIVAQYLMMAWPYQAARVVAWKNGNAAAGMLLANKSITSLTLSIMSSVCVWLQRRIVAYQQQ